MKNKKIIIIMSCLLIISLFVTGCKQEIEVKDGSKVAVSLKDGKITATEYYQEIKSNNVAVLVDMIDATLLNKKYPKTDEEDEKVEEQISQLKKNYTDADTLKAVLKQYFGVNDEEELEEMLRLEYKRNKAVEDYISKNLSDKEIKKYYDEKISGPVKVSHILITPSISEDADDEEKKTAEEDAKKTAEDIIKKLKKGEDFAKLAKKYSKENASAASGGDLGYIELDEVEDNFAEAVRKLKTDEYTKEPVKTKYGYHIILKTGEKEKEKLEDIEDDIREKITLQKLDADTTLYYQTLIDIRKENDIKFNDTVLEKQYNELMDQLLESAKQQ